MRLTKKERHLIRAIIHSKDGNAKIYLYGSRTKDELRGGDIDILVLSDNLEFKDKLDLLVALKMQLGDQKIDLTIKKTSSPATDPFVQAIFPDALPIEDTHTDSIC